MTLEACSTKTQHQRPPKTRVNNPDEQVRKHRKSVHLVMIIFGRSVVPSQASNFWSQTRKSYEILGLGTHTGCQ